MNSPDNDFLRQAIHLAADARQHGEFPFGAILVLNLQVVHQAMDRCLSYTDPTAHAERDSHGGEAAFRLWAAVRSGRFNLVII